MDRPTEEQIKKLPKWAQYHIRRLEDEVSDLRKTTDQMVNPASLIYYDSPGIYDQRKFKIPDSSSVWFRLGNESVHFHINRHNPEQVEVYASRTAVVVPQASNHFLIRVGD